MARGPLSDQLAGMDPLQRARYDAAVHRNRDAVAVHRATFESELRSAKDSIAELNRRRVDEAVGPHPGESPAETGCGGGDVTGEDATNDGRVRHERRGLRGEATAAGPVQSILREGR